MQYSDVGLRTSTVVDLVDLKNGMQLFASVKGM